MKSAMFSNVSYNYSELQSAVFLIPVGFLQNVAVNVVEIV